MANQSISLDSQFRLLYHYMMSVGGEFVTQIHDEVIWSVPKDRLEEVKIHLEQFKSRFEGIKINLEEK